LPSFDGSQLLFGHSLPLDL
jgi:hypothetical protein